MKYMHKSKILKNINTTMHLQKNQFRRMLVDLQLEVILFSHNPRKLEKLRFFKIGLKISTNVFINDKIKK